ncbi:hypothetical protein IAR55_003286 [Kwoniella newhampshirensis]|uniref:Signal peptidase complex subunit 2 n=1 Tax=Kwoniella newhampshirensis TaxID=1651941 RepID=A0AAW0YZ21_9TREE
MAPQKRAPNGVTITTSTPTSTAASAGGDTTSSLSSSTLANDPLPGVIVNNANLVEIKSALDDIVKKYLVDQSFTPSLVHPTVHLGLGYSSVILALASVLYSLRVDFEESKPVLAVAVIGYSVLQSALWAWKKWVEKGEVFRGKRRRMVKRIETDHVQIISSTTLKPPPPPAVTFSPHTRPSSPTSAPSSPSTISPATLSPSTSSTQITRQLSNPASASSSSLSSGSGTTSGPTYLVHLNLSTTSNNGKSLIHKSRVVVGRGVGEFVDEEGGVEEGEVVRWLGGLLSEAGLVVAEDEGTKEE